jgi:hypothetical protein
MSAQTIRNMFNPSDDEQKTRIRELLTAVGYNYP